MSELDKLFDINDHVTDYICGYCAKKYATFDEAKACMDRDHAAVKDIKDNYAITEDDYYVPDSYDCNTDYGDEDSWDDSGWDDDDDDGYIPGFSNDDEED